VSDLVGVVLVAAGAVLVIWALRKATTSGNIRSYDPIFWAGMVLAYLAVIWRALTGRFGVVWLGALGLFTVLPKFWMSRNGPIYYDETAHWALLKGVVAHGRLFQSTPLLPIGQAYPGMESVAATIHWVSGLSAWHSALLLIAVAHLLLPVQIYYVARALPISHRWAVVAGIVYAANPSFIYEDVMFAYESFAILLMLTIVRLYVEALADERERTRTWRQSIAALFLIAVMSFGCVVTHHLTSLTGVVVLLLAALTLRTTAPDSAKGAPVVDGPGGEPQTRDDARWRRLTVRWVPVATLAGFFGLWVAFVVPETIPYLFPHVSRPFSGALHLIGIGKGKSVFRTLFSRSTIPGYEHVLALAAPVIVAVALVFAAVGWAVQRRRRTGLARRDLLWGIFLAAIYLVSLPITLLPEGAAGAHRTWATTFVGVSLLPATLATVYAWKKRRVWLTRLTVVAGVATVIALLVGNVAAGTPVDYRYPGPYEFGSDTRSVTPETLSLARWVRQNLPAQAHVVTDRFTAIALTDHSTAVTPLHVPGLPIAAIWYSPRPPTPILLFTMQRHRDNYLAVDLRDSQHVPKLADLFVPNEPKRVPRDNLTRLANWPWLRLVYSSQHYRLYRINFARYLLWYPFHANDTN
jgi:hypothetical protein